MGKYVIDETTLTGIGDAIREKEGTTEAIPVSNMKARIQAIDTQEDLGAEMATQEELIRQIMAEAEGKVSGTRVCSVHVKDGGHENRYAAFHFTTLSAGEISYAMYRTHNYNGGYGRDFMVENVVCGSPIFFDNDSEGNRVNGITLGGGVALCARGYQGVCLIAPTEAGAKGVIELWPDN